MVDITQVLPCLKSIRPHQVGEPQTLTARPNRQILDLEFTLPYPQFSGSGKVNMSKNRRFGLSVRVGEDRLGFAPKLTDLYPCTRMSEAELGRPLGLIGSQHLEAQDRCSPREGCERVESFNRTSAETPIQGEIWLISGHLKPTRNAASREYIYLTLSMV